MVFRGAYPAPDLIPAPCGILSVAEVVTHTARAYDERWIRGYAHEFDSRPTVRLVSVSDASITGGLIFDGAGLALYEDVVPFFIETESNRSMLDWPGEQRERQVLMQLEAATQKAVERELWDGPVALDSSNGNRFLTETGAATEVVNGAHNAFEALYLLEGALADSPVGAAGVLHMTRDVASLLGDRLIYCGDENGKPRVHTRIGTPVVVGSGYSGKGPVGDAAAAASFTNRWMFATGPVTVHLGKPEIVNTDKSQGVDSSINSVIIKATRPAAVHFDPSCHYTAQVTLPSV